MKKVVCARCELVNLDTFPAFPFCEACGARLPSLRRFGRRERVCLPVLPLVGTVLLGAGVLVLLSAGLARDPRPPEGGALIAFGQGAPDPQVAGAQFWTFVFRSNDPHNSEPIYDLHLRLSLHDAMLWRVSIVSPFPDATLQSGKGRHFGWGHLARPAVRLRLTPPPSGTSGNNAKLPLWWSAEGFDPLRVELRATDSRLSWKPVRLSWKPVRLSWKSARQSRTLKP